jgi:hypothetical protein
MMERRGGGRGGVGSLFIASVTWKEGDWKEGEWMERRKEGRKDGWMDGRRRKEKR